MRPLIAITQAVGRFAAGEGVDEFFQKTLQPPLPSSPHPRFAGLRLTREGPDACPHPYGYFLPNLSREPDPSVVLLQEVARNLTITGVRPKRCGVILGAIVLPHESQVQNLRAHRSERFASSPAVRLARLLGLAGEVYSLDAACASSIYAIERGMAALQAGRQDLMVVGGLSRPDALFTQMGFHALGALSPSGQSLPLTQRADGLLVGEGCGLFVLKRLEDALDQGDEVLGVLYGAGLSTDPGRALLAPHAKGQLAAMRMAYEASGVAPLEVDYLECHATGTPLGDRTEMASVAELMHTRTHPLVVSSVKAYTGHALTAAGAAGLLRILGALRHDLMPPMHLASEAIAPLQGGLCTGLSEPRPWPRGKPRYGALNGFGFGGINGHLVVGDPPTSSFEPMAPKPFAVEIQEALLGEGQVSLSDQGYPGSFSLGTFWLDPKDYKTPPVSLLAMQPQQAYALAACKALLEDFGPLTGRFGVLIGVENDPRVLDFPKRWHKIFLGQAAKEPPLDADRVLGSLGGVVASRVAKALGVEGLGYTVSGEDGSGLWGLLLAKDYIARGVLDGCVVASVDLVAHRDLLGDAKACDSVAAVVLTRAGLGVKKPFSTLERVEYEPMPRTPPLLDRGVVGGLFELIEELEAGASEFHYGSETGFGFHIRAASSGKAVRRWTAPSAKKGMIPLSVWQAEDPSLPPSLGVGPWIKGAFSVQACHGAAHGAYFEAYSAQLASLQCLLLHRPEEALVQIEASAVSEPVIDYAGCVEFAKGRIEPVLGPLFREVDGFKTRVRLPAPPLLLCHRIMSISGEPLSMKPASLISEHDVEPEAWYLDGGKMPVAIAVEAGQADLFLSAYCGIDFLTRGERVYRLLDAKVCFHRELPKVSETIRYEIEITEFLKQQAVPLFRFQFQAYVGDTLFLTMRDGCAGFFTEEELAQGRGIVEAPLKARLKKRAGQSFAYPLPVPEEEAYSREVLEGLRMGDLTGLSPLLPKHLPNPPLPQGMLALVHRITALSTRGGAFGLGYVRGEADIDPKAWFLTCHFVGDEVMPGTLMYECCLHTLRVFMLRVGFVAADLKAEPLPEVVATLKCRGQVLASTKKVTYLVDIKEVGFQPDAYVIGDALMYADDVPIVEITDMNLWHKGLREDQLIRPAAPTIGTRYLYGPEAIDQIGTGRVADAYGEAFSVFDAPGRRCPRLPRAPYQFLEGISSVSTPLLAMKAGGEVVGHYPLSQDEWYYLDEGGAVPFCVLLEIPLQVCGFYSNYMGAPLLNEANLHYRNLGGHGVSHRELRGDEELTSHITCLKVTDGGGMILHDFAFAVRSKGELVYEGETSFGYFSGPALARQVGIRDPSPVKLSSPKGEYDWSHPFCPKGRLKLWESPMEWGLDSEGHWAAVAQRAIKADDWFFAAHFFEDPVMPGSLGVEMILQLMKGLWLAMWGARSVQAPWQSPGLFKPHRWIYRGQVPPGSGVIEAGVRLTHCSEDKKMMVGEGSLAVDGLTIYEVKDMTLALRT